MTGMQWCHIRRQIHTIAIFDKANLQDVCHIISHIQFENSTFYNFTYTVFWTSHIYIFPAAASKKSFETEGTKATLPI